MVIYLTRNTILNIFRGYDSYLIRFNLNPILNMLVLKWLNYGMFHEENSFPIPNNFKQLLTQKTFHLQI